MIQLDRFDPSRMKTARRHVRELGSVLVAYSGGVDSALLLALAREAHGSRAIAFTALSPAVAPDELRDVLAELKFKTAAVA